jgi:hypothetical protein
MNGNLLVRVDPVRTELVEVWFIEIPKIVKRRKKVVKKIKESKSLVVNPYENIKPVKGT